MNTLCVELVESIAAQCSQSTLYSLTRTSSWLHKICKPLLYKENVRSNGSSAVFQVFFGQNIDQDMVMDVLHAAREAGADVNLEHPCPQGAKHQLDGTLKPLQVALASKFHKVVDILLEEGAHVTDEDICWALENGLDEGAAKLIQFLDDQKLAAKPLVLHYAVAYHQQASTDLLLTAGYDINRPDLEDYTPIQAAVRNPGGNRRASAFLSSLIRSGADVNQRTIHGTALSMACSLGRFDIAKQLLNEGAEIFDRDFGEFDKNEVDNFYNFYDIGLWDVQDDITRCSQSAVSWSKWLLSQYPHPGITPRRTTNWRTLQTLQTFADNMDDEEEDSFFLGDPGPYTRSGTPIDVVLDSTLCAMLSIEHGNAEAARELLQAGYRVPSHAFRCIARTVCLFSENSYGKSDIDKIWPILLEVFPVLFDSTVLEALPHVLDSNNSFQCGMANIIRGAVAERFQVKGRKRGGQSESRAPKRIRIQD